MRIKSMLVTTCLLSAAFFLGACGGGDAQILSPNPGDPLPSVEDLPVAFSLAAGMTEITPDMNGTVSPSVDLGRFGINSFDRVYEVTTPAGEDFAFTLVARSPGNSGDTQISVGHGADGGFTPNGGAETIAGAGMVVEGAGVSYNNEWVDANGNGFARVTISGTVDSDQVLVVRVPQPDDMPDEIVGINVMIGDESEINQEETATATASTLTDEVIFTSDSYQFGLPAIAVSGDRYSIATYDGNSNDPFSWNRSRRWLQHDANTNMTTGGEADSGSQDFGNWRNQEIAALGNVLAIVSANYQGVSVDLSLDRGANFGNTVQLTENNQWGQNLVNIAIADDYRIGVIYWETIGAGGIIGNEVSTRLMLVEGTPQALDGNNTPMGYDFGEPQVIQQPEQFATPLVMQLAYSDGGDMVIGYGYTEAGEFLPDQPFRTSTSNFRCATRKAGETTFNDIVVDQEEGVIPMDPSVALRGSGATMEVFYAYERTDGIYLAYSSDGGQTFNEVTKVGDPGAFMPSVHVRDQAGEVRVDLLFLNPSAKGLELHNLHWDNFDASGAGSVLEALTEATRETVQDNSGSNHWLPFSKTVEIHDVAWFGYDAVTDGDDVAIIVHEQDRTSFDFMDMPLPVFGGAFGGALGGDANAPQAGGVPEAILLPGLGGAVDAPNNDHRNQLRLMVID